MFQTLWVHHQEDSWYVREKRTIQNLHVQMVFLMMNHEVRNM